MLIIFKYTKVKLTSKLPTVGTTIFTQMSALANEVGAINLSQGFPNFPVDTTFTQILTETIQKEVHQYAPMAGIVALREQIARIVFE